MCHYFNITDKVIVKAINLISEKRSRGTVNFLLTEYGTIKGFSKEPLPLMYLCEVEIIGFNSNDLCHITYLKVIEKLIDQNLGEKSLQLISILRIVITQNTNFLIELKHFFSSFEYKLKKIREDSCALIIGNIILDLMRTINNFDIENQICVECGYYIDLLDGFFISLEGIRCIKHKCKVTNISKDLAETFIKYCLSRDIKNIHQFKKLEDAVINFILLSKSNGIF